MFKKLASGLLVLLLILFVFAACNDDTSENTDEPISEIAAAFALFEKIYSLFDFSDYGADTMAYAVEFSTSVRRNFEESRAEGNVWFLNGGDNLHMLMDWQLSMSGTRIAPRAEIYISTVDGQATWQFLNGGDDISSTQTHEAILRQIRFVMGLRLNLPTIDISVIDSVNKNQDGENTIFTVVIDGSDLSDFTFNAIANTFMDLHFADEESLNLSFNNATIVITTDANGNLVSMTTNAGFRATYGGTTSNYSMTMEYRFSAFGDDVVIPAR